ncbi:MAG: KdsC family phosphatase [Planctomycetota bacterium]|jgi:3-deoxy-D-manno-octulosonate 8-phosphate phosphatase (KDO 8-P phosphatase)
MANTPAANIELLCLDVDGVMTDGGIRLDDNAVETKRFHVRDGTGIKIWMKLGYHVAIITGRTGQVVGHRARELGITHVIQGTRDKAASLDQLLGELSLPAEHAAVMADDLPDLPMMRRAGYAVAVADAVEEVRAEAAFVTTRPGGQGAVREVVEHLLKARDRWQEAVGFFG